MIKKKINLAILKSGEENSLITKMIANYNEGIEKSIISPRDLEGYLNFRNALWPTVTFLKLVKDEDEPNTFHVSEDGGKTFTLSLEWAETYTLETSPDDVTEALKGMPEPDSEIEKELN